MVRADLEQMVTTPASVSPVNDPLKIVEDYIVDSSAQVRQNAVSALAILAATDARALDVLVDMLLNERDAPVQAHLESQILGLPSELSGAFLQRLLAREARSGVWAWLARLRMKGFGAGQEKTVEALIRLAIDGSARTRMRAVDTLATLTGDEQKTAARALLAFLKSADRRVARETYDLLGTLRLKGSLLGYPSFFHRHSGEKPAGARGRIRAHVRRIWSKHGPGCIVDEPDVVKRRRATFSFIWMVVGWGALGALAMVIYLSTASPSPAPSFYAPFVLGVAVIGGLLGIAATRGATPIDRHYSRLAAGIREAMGAALRALLPAVLVLGTVLAIVSFDPGPRNWLRIIAESSLGMCLFIAAIRTGTIVAFGVMPQGRTDADERAPESKPLVELGETAPRKPGLSPRRSDRRSAFASSRWNFIAQIVVGTAAGLATATVFLAIARLQRAGVTPGMARLSEGLWIVLLPTAAGIASAFAWIDTPGGADDGRSIDEREVKNIKFGVPIHAGREQRLYRLARVTSIVLALVLVTGLGIVARTTLRATGATEQTHLAPSGQPLTLPPLRIGNLPVERSFAIGFPQRVSLNIPEQPEPPETDDVPDLVIDLFEWTPRAQRQGSPDCSMTTGKRLIQREDDPPKIERLLGWGCYTVEVTSTAGERQTLARAFKSVLDSRVAAGGGQSAWSFSLETTLNAAAEQGRVFSDDTASGSGVWLLSPNRTPRLEITAPTAVQFFLSALPASLTGGNPELPTAFRSTSPAPAGSSPFTVEILKDGASVEDDALRGRNTLQPGRYTLEVKATEGKAVSTSGIALNMRAATQPPRVNPSKLQPLVDGAAARRAETLSGYWMIGSQLPAAHHFRVNYVQDVELNLMPIENTDPLGIQPPRVVSWLLELRTGNRSGPLDDLAGLGQSMTSISGPSGRRRVTLKPGDYYLLALTRTQRSRAANPITAGAIAPTSVPQDFAVVELTLNAPNTADKTTARR